MRSRNGFTIVEALIATAILAVIAAFSSSIIVQVIKSNRYAERKFDSQVVAQQINEHVRLPETCRLALGTGSPSGQVVDEMRLLASGLDGNSGWEFEISIPGIGTGPDLSGTMLSARSPNNLIGAYGLKVDSLRFADGFKLPDSGLNSRYLATLYMRTSDLNGISFKDQSIGLTTLTLDPVTHRIVDCQNLPSRALQNSCAEMGCTYDPSQSPPCRCLRSQVMCAAPGSFAVSINDDGYPNCVQAGGDNACPAGEYLAGFGIGYRECVAVPTPAPTPVPTVIPPSPTPPSITPSPTATPACFNQFIIFFTYAPDCTGYGDDVVFNCPTGKGAPQHMYGTSGAPAHCGSIPGGGWVSECQPCP